MRFPSIVTLFQSPGIPYVLVLLGIILVGVGLGFWLHFGAGFTAAGVMSAWFGWLVGND